MIYIECPEIYADVRPLPTGQVRLNRLPSVFLGGGITNCPNWQKYVVEQLADVPITLLNPRRANFPINDPSASDFQIRWERDHLEKADIIIFWFPSETLCPITLYELGFWTNSKKCLIVGTHPNYQRRTDVVIQTQLSRPTLEIFSSLDEIIRSLKKSFK